MAQRINSRAAKQQVRNQTQKRAQTLSNQQSTVKQLINPETGQIDEKNGVLTERTINGPLAPSTKGGFDAISNLQRVADTGITNEQKGIRDRNEIKQDVELRNNLRSVQSGAGGQSGALGFNPDGVVSSHDQNGLSPSGTGDSLDDRLKEQKPVGFKQLANTTAVNDFNESQVRLREAHERLKQAQVATQEQQQESEARRSAANDAAKKARVSTVDAMTTTMSPEDQAVADSYKDIIDLHEQMIADAKQVKVDGQEVIDSNFDDEEAMIEEHRAKKLKDFTFLQNELKEDKRLRQQFLADEKKHLLEALEFTKTKQLREAEAKKRAMLDQQIASLVLSGGFGSSNGNASIRQAELAADAAMNDLENEFGLRKDAIVLEFRDSYLKAQEDYSKNFLKAWSEYQDREDALDVRSLSSVQTRRKEEQKNLERMTTAIESAKLGLAKEIKSQAENARSRMDQEIEARSKKQEGLWDRLYKHYQVFGGNNPDMEKNILSEMRREGINTTGIKTGIATAGEISDAMRQAQKGSGRALPSSRAIEIGEIEESMSLLNDFEQRVEDGEFNSLFGTDARGPIEGNIGQLLPWGATRRFMASSKLVKQIIGKGLEGGVLRKEDEVKYQHIIPNETDSNAVLRNKFDTLRQALQNKKAIKINSLRKAGYNVEEFDVDPLYFEEMNVNHDDAQRIMEDLSSGTFEGGEYISMLTGNGGTITQSYDTPVASREHGGFYEPSTVKAWGGTHKGVDIAVPVGTEIPAIADMKIIDVTGSDRSKSGWGLSVVAEDKSGRRYRWSHLSKANVKKGDKVPQGQLIALSGNSGNSTGPHIDFRVKKSGKYIDPFSLLS